MTPEQFDARVDAVLARIAKDVAGGAVTYRFQGLGAAGESAAVSLAAMQAAMLGIDRGAVLDLTGWNLTGLKSIIGPTQVEVATTRLGLLKIERDLSDPDLL